MTVPIPDPPKYVYMSHIQNRHPITKYHTNIGHAKNAVNSHRGGLIMGLNTDGTWSTLFNVPPNTRWAEMPWRVEKVKADAEVKQKAEDAREQEIVRKVNEELNDLFDSFYVSPHKTERIIEIVKRLAR